MKTLTRPAPTTREPLADVVTATGGGAAALGDMRARARAFAEPRLAGESNTKGEKVRAHADPTADILAGSGGSDEIQAAVYLSYASAQLSRPDEVIGKAFGDGFARLAIEASKLERVQQRSRVSRQDLSGDSEQAGQQTEFVRKMLLAFSRDLRVILLRLASRLQTLRWCASARRPPAPSLLRESHEVFAPLANRLGIWQVKWEMEDLIFRAQEPDAYRLVASLLDEKRIEREAALEQKRSEIESALRKQGVDASVTGRPKHISSIVRKMRGKGLDFDRVFDVRALRIMVPTVVDCYSALGWVHQHFTPVPEEFDDYIAKPKPNGYQSLHTVVRDEQGKPWEIQIRTPDMHAHAEHGVAAHWAYKEAGTKGYAGVSAAGDFEDRVAQARRAVLQQLLAWERDFVGHNMPAQGFFEDRIYVFTPAARLIELPAGATAVDFAYNLHTDLGHRCRGARVDGQMVPLNTPLQSGQTIEVIAAKEGGPSLDWLNPQQGYLKSQRSRAKARAWFNARALQDTIARGREAVDRLLQREGRTAIRLDDLAAQLGFRNAEALFELVGKDEYSLRNIESVLRPPPAPAPLTPQEEVQVSRPATGALSGKSAVLVVGVESLLTQLAHCCRPAPPDAIGGFVTRGKGVAVHRSDCANFRQLAARHLERIIEVQWGEAPPVMGRAPVYPVNVSVMAHDRQGLLRDISEVFAREKTNVIGVHTQSMRGTAWMTFTIEVSSSAALAHVLAQVAQIGGVLSARRK